MKTTKPQSAIFIALLSLSLTAIAKENIPGSGMIVNTSQARELQSNCAPATAQSDLDINNVRAKILGGGDMWWDLFTGSYFVPKPAAGTKGVSAMYAASLWIGGYDAGGVLKVAGQTYRQTGNDFWPGPLNSNGATDAATCSAWDKQYMVNKEDVEKVVLDPSGSIPNSILNWPTISANGAPMAPYYDSDGNGSYDPTSGDYPDFWLGDGSRPPGFSSCDAKLYGDQAIWWVFNDKGNIHSETQGPAIGLEIQAQAFAFKTNDEINNMTFYKYKITNKSSFRLDSTFFGVWCDSDLGGFNDDYVGCDVEAGLGYSYNGDLIDGPSGNGELVYGANPPAVGIDFFEGPFADPDGIDNSPLTVPNSFTNYGDNIPDNERLGMGKFVYYNNNTNTVNGNPQGANDFYKYLTATWRNGQRITYGGDGTSGSTPCNYMFPGDSDPKGWGTGSVQPVWDEVSESNEPFDRRFLQSAGPFKLQPGATNTITLGVPWARATQGGNLASIGLLKGADEKAQELFKNCFKTLDGPTAPELTIQELDKELILYWTNPETSNNKNENYKEDYDLTSNLDIPYTFQGYMVFQLKDAFVSTTDLYNVDKSRLVFQCDKVDAVSQIVNYYNDPNISALVPQEMVNGANKGLVHSVKITEDKFATGNNGLVNHKTYYYAVVAYGYSKTKDAPNFAIKKDYLPFLAGRKQAGGNFSYAAIPHIINPEMGGTAQQSYYGSGPKIKRIEGQGNGGNVLDFTEETANRILNSSSHRVIDPVYEGARGPVNITVIDPLNVPKENEFRFILKAKYPTSYTPVSQAAAFVYIPQDSSSWELQNVTTGEIVKSEKTIKFPNQQIINGQASGTTNVIPKWGLSVNVKFVLNPGPTFDSIIPGTNPTINFNLYEPDNGFLEASMTFVDPTKRWLTGVSDQDGESNFNWIRAGAKTTKPVSIFDDLKGDDDEEHYEKILNGTWAPYRLCRFSSVTTLPVPYHAGASWNNAASIALNSLKNLASIDVIITSDKSKWTRCPVLEMQEDPTLSIGGAVKMSRRKSPSVDRQGKKAGDIGYQSTEGDLNGTIGMGWFPGYALNLETGERLNMAFGEDSWLGSENGSDMMWNPTASITSSVDGLPLFGGKHYIYVFGHNGDVKYVTSDPQIPGGLRDVPRYDEGKALSMLYAAAENALGGASDGYKREIYADAMWVNIPLVASGHSVLETDVKIRIRVAKQYKRSYSSVADSTFTQINKNYSVYDFNTSDIATTVYDNDVAKKALDLINVVPNPYYAYSSYEQNTLQNNIKITNLPEKCKIAIYTLNGNLVRVFNKDDPKTSLDWDLKNTKRIPIASGLYIIHVDVPGLGERTLKWFGVMRPIDLESF